MKSFLSSLGRYVPSLGFLMVLGFLLAPDILFAAPANFKEFVGTLINLGNRAIRALGAIVVVVFLWSIARFILSSGSSQRRAEDKTFLLWSVLAMFVLFSVWGLVLIIKNTLSV